MIRTNDKKAAMQQSAKNSFLRKYAKYSCRDNRTGIHLIALLSFRFYLVPLFYNIGLTNVSIAPFFLSSFWCPDSFTRNKIFFLAHNYYCLVHFCSLCFYFSVFWSRQISGASVVINMRKFWRITCVKFLCKLNNGLQLAHLKIQTWNKKRRKKDIKYYSRLFITRYISLWSTLQWKTWCDVIWCDLGEYLILLVNRLYCVPPPSTMVYCPSVIWIFIVVTILHTNVTHIRRCGGLLSWEEFIIPVRSLCSL